MTRDPLFRAILASGLLAAGLVAGLRADRAGGRPVVVYVAASLRPAIETCAADFSAATGRPVELRAGGSEHLLVQLARAPGDVYAPADDSYLLLARERGHAGAAVPLGRMRAVVLTKSAQSWADVTKPGHRVALAQPESAAVGRLTRDHLIRSDKWRELSPNIVVTPDTVTESALAVRAGAADSAVVWDVVAAASPQLRAVTVPELDGVYATVAAAPLSASPDPEGGRLFLEHLTSEAGRRVFARHGFAAP